LTYAITVMNFLTYNSQGSLQSWSFGIFKLFLQSENSSPMSYNSQQLLHLSVSFNSNGCYCHKIKPRNVITIKKR
jgi:hypothetical protein